VIVVGQGLRFSLTWESKSVIGTAAEASRGHLAAHIGDRQVWGQDGTGFLWSWVELLEHLADTWSFLEWEEVDPLGLGESPEYIRLAALKRWEETPSRSDQEEKDLWEFERCHNLAAALQGAWPPDLWLLRQGNVYVLSGAGIRLTEAQEAVLATLNQLGEVIAARLRQLTDPRAHAAVSSWERRRDVPIHGFVSAATSLNAGVIGELVGSEDPRSFWELGDSLEPTEVMAAARMIGPDLSAANIRQILQKIRRLPRRRTQHIDQLASQAQSLNSEGLPYEEGYFFAEWLRQRLACGDAPVDPSGLLGDWGVGVVSAELPTSLIDAIACWGPAHGPAVLLNTAGHHTRGVAGRRATLAHEIGRLLIDRRRSLPLAEVLGGRTPRATESRARAFAAELLLPRAVAGAALAGTTDPEGEVRRLCRRYGVSREVAAWQARNAMMSLRPAVTDYLSSLVSRPGSFMA
jgi:hypothetical protein